MESPRKGKSSLCDATAIAMGRDHKFRPDFFERLARVFSNGWRERALIRIDQA